MKKWILWVGVVGVVMFLGLWLVSRQLIYARANQAAQATIKAASVLPTPQSMQEKLMDPNVDLQARKSLMEKIEIQNRVAANEKAGQTRPASKEAAPAAPAALIASSLVETGIFEGSEGMIRPEQARIQNYWRGLVDGKVYMLMAGSTADDQSQGLIVLMIASLDPSDSTISFDYYDTPLKNGSLRVVDAQGERISLQASGGLKFQFDVKKKIFVQ